MVIVFLYAVAIGVLCSLGFGVLSNITIIGFGILDFLDFMSNSVLMPIVGMLTCIVIGFVVKPKTVIDEVELNGKFRMKKFYTVMVKWIAPICILIILVSSVLDALGIVKL